MSCYVPTKEHLRQAMLLYFYQKKNASQCHRLLMETYPGSGLSIRMCQRWFSRFKSGNFDVTDEERSGPPKKFADEELRALLEENPCRTLKELANSLNVTRAAVSIRLKAMGVTQIQGNWVPYQRDSSQNNQNNDKHELSTTPGECIQINHCLSPTASNPSNAFPETTNIESKNRKRPRKQQTPQTTTAKQGNCKRNCNSISIGKSNNASLDTD